MISSADMNHLLQLARLELAEHEQEALKEDVSRTLEYFNLLNEVDTEGVEAMQRPIDIHTVLRADVVDFAGVAPAERAQAGSAQEGDTQAERAQGLSHDEAMTLATEAHEGFFKVPRMLEGN